MVDLGQKGESNFTFFLWLSLGNQLTFSFYHFFNRFHCNIFFFFASNPKKHIMDAFTWLVVVLALHMVHGIGTWRFFELAGLKRWAAFVPVYNLMCTMRIINRPGWWTLLLYIPIINLLMIPVMWVELLRSFGHNSTKDTWLAVCSLGLYVAFTGYTQPGTHIPNRSLMPSTKGGETLSSIVFAVVVATVVHTYLIQPFVIPTSSLEKSLLVGDFLFVSKFHYGARTPMTPLAAPMVHDTIPLVKTKSYLSWPQLPYFRLPGFETIAHNDIVVFNWPADTVYRFFDRSGRSVRKPIDKKSNYVKRCVGLPGDTLSIRYGDVYINGHKSLMPERAKPQYYYTLVAKTPIDEAFLNTYGINRELMYVYQIKKSFWDDARVQQYFASKNQQVKQLRTEGDEVVFWGNIDEETFRQLQIKLAPQVINVNLTQDLVDQLRKDPNVLEVQRFEFPLSNAVFPQTTNLKWSVDQFGPIYIPKAGSTVALTEQSYPFYKKAIRDYEGQNIKQVGHKFYINDKEVNYYTFTKNYYWMMGDNRHNSEDSRYWGFVPDDHIIGKPVFIWFSFDTATKSIRWERLFTTVSGQGQPQSYFRWFLFALVGYYVGRYFWDKRKKA